MADKPSGLCDDHLGAQLVEFVPQFSRVQLARDAAQRLAAITLILRPRDLVADDVTGDDVIARRCRRRSFLRFLFRSDFS